MLLALVSLFACTDPASSPTPGAVEGVGSLVTAIEAENLLGHLEALQAAADASGNNRSAGTAGYARSVDYVVQQLEDAGYTPVLEPFTFSPFRLHSAGLAQVTPEEQTLTNNQFSVLTYSAAGAVAAPVTAVAPTIPPGAENSTDAGCVTAHFEGFPAGHVALIQRGGCTFQEKVMAAQDAGAVAVVLFNEGQPGRRGVVRGTLLSDPAPTIPVVGIGYWRGADWVEAAEDRLGIRIAVDAEVERVETQNILARTPDNPGTRIVVGAHLDSVPDGAGINDNGSGSALVLELARQVARLDGPLTHQVEFAWWGAKEWGLLGSSHHVQGLDTDDLQQIRANLNFDMIGSPNGFRLVMDTDGSTFPNDELPSLTASGDIEEAFKDWFDAVEQPWGEIGMEGRSDYAPFLMAGVPVGGLFTGTSREILSDEAADSTGGAGGQPMDPCYHQDCDTLLNVDPRLWLEMSQAAAHVTQQLATEELQPMANPPNAALAPTPWPAHLMHTAHR